MIEMIFFIIYFLAFIAWIIFSSMIHYHLCRYDYPESPCKKIYSAYLGIAIVIVALTILFGLFANWDFDRIYQFFS